MPRPVRAAYSMPYGAAFGAPRAGGSRSHQGADYHAPTWTPIYGTADGGRVAHIGENHDPNLGLGHNITIVYPGGVKTLDGHMVTRTPLAYAQTVNSDTLVGYVGATGNAVNGSPPGPHDHHMRWHNGVLVDPETVYGTQPAGGGSTPIPITDEDEHMRIIQPYNMPDRGVIGAGIGIAFGNQGDFIHFTNANQMDRNVVTVVGSPSETEAQRRALFMHIINMHRAGSSPAIPTPPTAAQIAAEVKKVLPAGTGSGPTAEAIAELVADKLAARLKD